jgi:hypothetical protein
MGFSAATNADGKAKEEQKPGCRKSSKYFSLNP